MSTTLSNPRASVAMTASLEGGTSPASLSASASDKTTTSFTVGTTAGKVERVYTAARTVTTGTDDAIDLSDLTDPANESLAFAHISAIKIHNSSSTDGEDLTIGGGSNPLFAELPFAIPPGGDFYINVAAGEIAVTSSSSGSVYLNISVAAGTAVPYTITIFGRAA